MIVNPVLARVGLDAFGPSSHHERPGPSVHLIGRGTRGSFAPELAEIHVVETRAEETELTLPALLARRARKASDERLVLDAGGGLVVAALVVAFRPPGWSVLVSAAAVFFAFGVWGISDRMIADQPTSTRASRVMRALRAAAAGLGVVSAVALVGTAMALMLGTWIS